VEACYSDINSQIKFIIIDEQRVCNIMADYNCLAGLAPGYIIYIIGDKNSFALRSGIGFAYVPLAFVLFCVLSIKNVSKVYQIKNSVLIRKDVRLRNKIEVAEAVVYLHF